MARMFPSEPLEPITSAAEVLLFDLMRDELADDFTVLHSVKWLSRKEGRDRDGETDFLIAHPRHGILLVEVKGGEIGCDPVSGKWYSRNRRGETFTIKNPFEQAKLAYYGLRDKFRDANFSPEIVNSIKRVVALPDIEVGARDLGPDAPRSLIIDATDIRTFPQALMRAWQPDTSHPIGDAGVAAVVNLLSPAVDLRHPRLSSAIEREREVFVRLTRDQMRVLDLFSSHRRAAVRGVAGSGKSLLAVEAVRRLAEQGFSVLYTCFNQALADWARDALREVRHGDLSNVYVDNYHDLAEDFSRRAGISLPTSAELEQNASAYYREVLPQHLMDALAVVPDRFDAIVVDEGQDFDDVWWLTLESLLADPENGIFYIFYDNNQLLFLDRGDSYPIPPPHLQLQWNCRNTRCINKLSSGYGAGLAVDHCLGPDGRDPELIPVKPGALGDALRRVIHRLTAEERVPLKDIVVLTPRAQHRSELRHGLKLGNYTLSWAEAGQDKVQITSIHKFKGLQSPVVILAELDQAYWATRDAIIHVGLTRAQHHLIVLGELPAPGTR